MKEIVNFPGFPIELQQYYEAKKIYVMSTIPNPYRQTLSNIFPIANRIDLSTTCYWFTLRYTKIGHSKLWQFVHRYITSEGSKPSKQFCHQQT